MSETLLKKQIVDALWGVTDRNPNILSATLTGSFAKSSSLDGLSDIDFVVIVGELSEHTWEPLQQEFQHALEPILSKAGYEFQLNSSFGPLKFNRDRLAVLHLMVYSKEGHVEHVINSPFTCLDWQESGVSCKHTLQEIFPTFALQPHHFLSARRSVKDYLNDFRKRVVSYRELHFDGSIPCEVRCEKPMDQRDRHEFAYHVMRFLMLNFLKLVRKPSAPQATLIHLMDRYFQLFPAGEEDARKLLVELAERKRAINYAHPIENLDCRLEAFVESFELQFKQEFCNAASQHILFRHAPTQLNGIPLRFQGRTDPNLVDSALRNENEQGALRSQVEIVNPQRFFSSPLKRCIQSLQRAFGNALPVAIDERLVEIDCGVCDERTVADCRANYPELFEAWRRGEDPRFPNGENTHDVVERVQAFVAEELGWDSASSVICTHNVVLRCLVGELLGVPRQHWHQLRIPHMVPMRLIATKKFGNYIELDAALARMVFEGFGAELTPHASSAQEQAKVAA